MNKYSMNEIEKMQLHCDVVKCCEYVTKCLFETLTHLPKNVVDKIVTETVIRTNNGQHREGYAVMNCRESNGKHYISIIGIEIDNGQNKAMVVHALLHEFAHVILEHIGKSTDTADDTPKQAHEVSVLLGQWAKNDEWVDNMLLQYRNRYVNW